MTTLTDRTWVRYPPLDDHQMNVRMYVWDKVLPIVDVHGHDFLRLSGDGTYTRRNHGRFTSGTWDDDTRMLHLYDDDVLVETLGYKVEGERLITG